MHRIGRTGRVGRSGRAITFVEPRQQRELEAIEQHIGTTITPVVAGREGRAGDRSRSVPSRHEKPHISARRRRAVHAAHRRASGATRAWSSPTSSTRSPHAAGVDGEAVKDVKVLGKFSLLSVPESEAERVIEQVTGEQVNGTSLKLEQVKA